MKLIKREESNLLVTQWSWCEAKRKMPEKEGARPARGREKKTEEKSGANRGKGAP